jgi:hypothetical protein
MSKNMENNIQGKKLTGLKIEMVQEVALDKKGKEVIDREGNKNYKREDFMGLMNLLSRFDSTRHTMKDYKFYIKLKDKIHRAWSEENRILDLSLDDATFLKTYLSEYSEKEGKNVPLAEYEMRTLIGILEQME